MYSVSLSADISIIYPICLIKEIHIFSPIHRSGIIIWSNRDILSAYLQELTWSNTRCMLPLIDIHLSDLIFTWFSSICISQIQCPECALTPFISRKQIDEREMATLMCYKSLFLCVFKLLLSSGRFFAICCFHMTSSKRNQPMGPFSFPANVVTT